MRQLTWILLAVCVFGFIEPPQALAQDDATPSLGQCVEVRRRTWIQKTVVADDPIQTSKTFNCPSGATVGPIPCEITIVWEYCTKFETVDYAEITPHGQQIPCNSVVTQLNSWRRLLQKNESCLDTPAVQAAMNRCYDGSSVCCEPYTTSTSYIRWTTEELGDPVYSCLICPYSGDCITKVELTLTTRELEMSAVTQTYMAVNLENCDDPCPDTTTYGQPTVVSTTSSTITSYPDGPCLD